MTLTGVGIVLPKILVPLRKCVFILQCQILFKIGDLVHILNNCYRFHIHLSWFSKAFKYV